MLTESPYTKGTIIYADRRNDLFLIRTDSDIVFETWSSSTKHPDSIHKFNSWENKSRFIDNDFQVYQWLLFIASDTLIPFHAKEIVDFATEVYHILNE